MKRKIFCSFFCVNNIFSADEEYITFTEPKKLQIYCDFEGFYNMCFFSPENFKIKKKDFNPNVLEKKLDINACKNFAIFDKSKNIVSDYNVNLADSFKGKKWIIKYIFKRDKDDEIFFSGDKFDHYSIDLYEKKYFNNESKLILNGINFNLKEIYICNDVLNLNSTNEEQNLNNFKDILGYFKDQIKNIPYLYKNSICIESYKIEDEESRIMKKGDKFSKYIADYIKSVRDGKKTELVINSFANYECSKICLNDDLDKKYYINDDREKYDEFKENVENFIEKLNKKKDKKLLSDEKLTELIQKEFGKDISIKCKDIFISNKKSVEIIINDINNYKNFINSKKIHLSFEAPDGYIFEDTFNPEVDVDFSEMDDINEDTPLYDCVSKISKIDLKTIKNEIKWRGLDKDDDKLKDFDSKYLEIFYNIYYKIKIKEHIKGITKEFDKNNLLINIKFNIDDNIKANYELDGNFNNIISPNNKIKIGKKISDLKTYIDNNLGKNITNYELKENDKVVTDDNKELTNNTTYIFTFKEGSNCIKEKPKKTDPTEKPTENSTENSTEENDTNDIINNKKGGCLCSGKNNKDKKGCC